MKMKKSDECEVGLKIGDCLQFDLENGTLKVFHTDSSGNTSGRRTREGDDKFLLAGSCDKVSRWRIAEVILFTVGMCDCYLEDVSTSYGNRPDTLITFKIVDRDGGK